MWHTDQIRSLLRRVPPLRGPAALALGLLGATGCAVLPSPPSTICGYTVATPSDQDTGVFRAGVARVEITPPPGYPSGGHGMAGGVARGYSTRLWVRAFYLSDGQGHQLVLGSADLFVLPGSLHDRVAKNVARLGVAPGEILLAATHTHQSPGNFASASVYNEFGSRESGYAPELFEFLVSRVTEAVEIAIADANRTQGAKVDLVRYEGRLDDLLLNRAPREFLLNPDAQRVMNSLDPRDPTDWDCKRKELEPEEFWGLPGCPRLRAVDRSMSLLEIRRDGNRVGLLIFASVHPTVLHHNAALYSSDFTGQAVSALERVWHSSRNYPVVAFFNGAEGDVVARRTSRDLLDVARLSRRFAAAVEDTLNHLPPHSEALQLEAKYDEGREARGSSCVSGERAYTLATDPAFGVATLGGAEGDRTVLYDLGWRTGVVGRAKHGQGPKLPGLDSAVLRGFNLTNLLAGSWKYPAFLPVSYVRIGSLVLAGVPVEMTTRASFIVRSELQDPDIRVAVGALNSAPGGVSRVRIVGLANDYASYVTTTEEYMAQEYIGASTIWGPDEAQFLACTLKCLAEKPAEIVRKITSKAYRPGWPTTTPFGPAFCGDARRLPDEENELLFTETNGAPVKSLPWFRWTEGAVSPITSPPSKMLRRIRILERLQGRWQPRRISPPVLGTNFDEFQEYDRGDDDDLGFNLVVTLMDGSQPGRNDYAAIWTRSLRGPIDGEFMFEVLQENASAPSHEDQRVCSAAFRLPTFQGGAVGTGSCPSVAPPISTTTP
jgi:neutral ceramidase